MQLKDKMIE